MDKQRGARGGGAYSAPRFIFPVFPQAGLDKPEINFLLNSLMTLTKKSGKLISRHKKAIIVIALSKVIGGRFH